MARYPILIPPFQRVGFDGFKAQVQVQQLPPQPHKLGKLRLKVQTRKLAQQFNLPPLLIGRVVQHRVGIGEDVLGGDAVVAVMLPELPQPPLGDVAHPLTVRRVAVEGQGTRPGCRRADYPENRTGLNR